ncbi:MAG TPA: type II/IV secretion system protein [Candidatus Moranbacteria bacterium]|nr:type II/IV secretion system protein [Candidatus Moranbacteria bacterium]
MNIQKYNQLSATIGLKEKSIPAKAEAKKNFFKNDKGKKSAIAKLNNPPKTISSAVIGIIPESVAKKYKIASFEKRGNLVKVAMVNPSDLNALNALRFVAEKENVKIEAYLTSQEVFEEILKNYNGPSEIVKEAIKSFKNKVIFEDVEKETDKSKKQSEILKEAPVTKLVQVIISHAVEDNASDIHIEPMDKDYRVRFRIDGILHTNLIIPKEIGPAVVSRIKILANLKIDEKRKPQDGRFRTINEGRKIDFRVSTLPVILGEKIVLRILDKSKRLNSIETLGLVGTALENIKLAIQETYGMILFTGPTGSGKSTSLYALLEILNKDKRNIITLEDPIEYNIEGLNQSQIKPEIGYTFANGLRTILRQDPNIIMVGEIRDNETAELAVHAALTGHLMFSTLHTNTAIGAIPRLVDMGIEPFLLSSSLRTVVAQRLVRKICEKCKEEQKIPHSLRDKLMKELSEIPSSELKKYQVDLSKEIKFYHGKGCDACGGTGLKGRMAIYEVVPVDDDMKTIIVEKNSEEKLLEKIRKEKGILTIRQDGLLKAAKGLTTIEEVERVTEGKVNLVEEND